MRIRNYILKTGKTQVSKIGFYKVQILFPDYAEIENVEKTQHPRDQHVNPRD